MTTKNKITHRSVSFLILLMFGLAILFFWPPFFIKKHLKEAIAVIALSILLFLNANIWDVAIFAFVIYSVGSSQKSKV